MKTKKPKTITRSLCLDAEIYARIQKAKPSYVREVGTYLRWLVLIGLEKAESEQVKPCFSRP